MVQQTCKPSSASVQGPMTKASFTATGMASPCKDFWALVDLIAHPPFLKSPKPKAASQFDRSQMARVQRGLVSMVRVAVFQPLIALPSLLPSFHCLQLLPAAGAAAAKEKCVQACTLSAASEEGQPYRHWRKRSTPRLHPQAMPWSRRIAIGMEASTATAAGGPPSRCGRAKAVSGSPLRVH
ncbi:hypothetical protein V8E51_000752 [Hyaloscypha variabilis]